MRMVSGQEPGKQWAVKLLRQEATGAHVAYVAQGAWRAALGFDEKIDAADALKQWEKKTHE